MLEISIKTDSTCFKFRCFRFSGEKFGNYFERQLEKKSNQTEAKTLSTVSCAISDTRIRAHVSFVFF